MTDEKNSMRQEDELMLNQFLAVRRQVIPDEGFTCRVMRQLPDRALWLSRAWTGLCIAIAAVAFVALGGIQHTLRGIVEILCHAYEWAQGVAGAGISLGQLYAGYVVCGVALLGILGYQVINDRRHKWSL